MNEDERVVDTSAEEIGLIDTTDDANIPVADEV